MRKVWREDWKWWRRCWRRWRVYEGVERDAERVVFGKAEREPSGEREGLERMETEGAS